MRRRLCGAIAVSLAIFVPGCCLCPRVERIAGPAEGGGPPLPCPTYGVLLAPSGFEKEDLPAYRVATQELADGLLHEAGPFRLEEAGTLGPGTAALPCQKQIRLEFFRIELVGRRPSPECSAGNAGQPLRTPSSSRAVRLGVPRDSCRSRATYLPLDLAVEVTDCEDLSIGSVEQEEALSLARFVPGIDAVVVVVNLDDKAGRTLQVGDPNSIGFALIGVDLPDPAGGTDDADQGYVSQTAVDLLGHELGHALGLFDEYVDVEVEPDENLFRGDRNVWKEAADSRLSCTSGGGLYGNVDSVPWRSRWVAGGLSCRHVDSHLVYTVEGDSSPGLWEGAFYQDEGYFRSAQNCRMNDTRMPFCAICSDYLEATLRLFSQPANVGPEQASP